MFSVHPRNQKSAHAYVYEGALVAGFQWSQMYSLIDLDFNFKIIISTCVFLHFEIQR